MAKYSLNQIMTVLNWAKKHGTISASKHFGIQSSTIVRWNAKYQVYEKQEMRQFSEQQKIEILTFAEQYSLIAAVEKYNIGTSVINKWNKVYKIYTKVGRKSGANYRYTKTEYSEEFKKTVLGYAKEHGPSEALRKYQIPESTLRMWNKIYRIYPVRKARKFSEAQKLIILRYAEKNGAAQAARQYDLTSDLISQWYEKLKDKIK